MHVRCFDGLSKAVNVRNINGSCFIVGDIQLMAG